MEKNVPIFNSLPPPSETGTYLLNKHCKKGSISEPLNKITFALGRLFSLSLPHFKIKYLRNVGSYGSNNSWHFFEHLTIRQALLKYFISNGFNHLNPPTQ